MYNRKQRHINFKETIRSTLDFSINQKDKTVESQKKIIANLQE